MVEDARQRQLIKEEEEITKSNVKTLIDAEHAENQRKKLVEQRYLKNVSISVTVHKPFVIHLSIGKRKER